MSKAVTYSRYSSDQQRESSIIDQQRNMHQRAHKEGWTITKDYADAAMSGTLKARPQYQALIKAAELREFDVLLLDDLSRLSRDSIETEKTIRKLEFAGVRIIAVSDGYDSTSKSRKIQRGFKALMNETFIDDLAERVHRGQKGQALLGRWNGGRPYGYKLQRLRDESRRDQYGEAMQIGTTLVPDEAQTLIVREIFDRYALGQSALHIASTLNERGVPSPGSTWNRKTRRCEKWVQSAIRVILTNPLYKGVMRWNRRQFVRDPETGKEVARRRRPEEFVMTEVPAFRIVSDDVFERCAARLKIAQDPDQRLRQGGKRRHALSGLLRCDACGRSYVIADANFYACSSVINGGKHACTNHMRVRRDALEAAISAEVVEKVLSPDNVERWGKELAKRLHEQQTCTSSDRADEIGQLEDRIVRLRRRLKDGDPDLDSDELLVAIAAAEAKRAKLAAPKKSASVTILASLPKAAERMRKQIAQGFKTGDVEAAARAREILRRTFGVIRLRADERGLWAESEMIEQPLKILATDQTHISVVGVTGFEPATYTSRT